MRIAVTGSTGFIGSHLIPALLHAGHEVTAVSEAGQKGELEEVKAIPVDVTTGEGLEEVFLGADAVIHLAARNHVLKDMAADPLAEYRRVNVEGTQHAVRAAIAAGTKTFLHFSSVKTMGEGSDAVLDEESVCAPKTPYGISKLESEEAVRTIAAGSGMHAAILRLPMVYGPRNRGNFPRLIWWARKGLPFPLFQPDNLRSMVYVGNVVAGVMTLLKRPPEGVSTYILKDSEDYSTRRVYSAVCHELRTTPRFVPVPAVATRIGGLFSEDLRKLAGSFRVSSAKIEKEIGFIPPFSFDEGVARTVRWSRNSVL